MIVPPVRHGCGERVRRMRWLKLTYIVPGLEWGGWIELKRVLDAHDGLIFGDFTEVNKAAESPDRECL